MKHPTMKVVLLLLLSVCTKIVALTIHRVTSLSRTHDKCMTNSSCRKYDQRGQRRDGTFLLQPLPRQHNMHPTMMLNQLHQKEAVCQNSWSLLNCHMVNSCRRVVFFMQRQQQRLRRQSIRRRIISFLVVATIVTGGGLQPTWYNTIPHAYATTTSLTMVTNTREPRNELDTIVDRYVQRYMWDAEKYDPIDSLYRELYHDVTTNNYPMKLREIISKSGIDGSVRGIESTITATTPKTAPRQWIPRIEIDFGRALLRAITTVQRKTGWQQSTVIAVVAFVLVFSAPTVLLGGSMVLGGISKRSMNKVFKQRYGDTYSVDATAKREVQVEAPDDDDDDDDDDEEDDENSDDDNDDNDDNEDD
jgi:hypothetical protein